MPHPSPRSRLAGATALAAALLASAPAPAQQPADPGAVAFVGVNVIPMDRERVLADQTVVVRGGRIAEVGPRASVRVPQGAQVVQAAGKYLMPGLAEMHAHIPPAQAGAEAVDRTLFLYLAGGVTTARGMLGQPLHLELRERSARGELLAPRIYTSGPSLNGNSATEAAAAARMVEEQKAAGYDLLKLHPGLSRPVFDAIDAAADRVGISYAGHVSGDVGLDRALRAGYASIDHLDGYVEALAGHGDRYTAEQTGFFGLSLVDRADASRIPELAARTREAGVWNVPTQSLMEQLASAETPEELARRPELRYMPQQTVENWMRMKREFQANPAFTPERGARYVELRRGLIRELHRAGAGLLLGSDAPQWWNVPGFSARRELGYLVDAGLTPYQALETGTRNPAVYFGEEERWGTVQPGRAADLLLLDANPLEDVDNLWRQAGVMVRGRWLPQAEIDRRLEEIHRAVRG